MFSNLIDLTLVEYSTSKLKTHIKRKVSPVGHSKCLQKVLHWLRLLLWFRQKQYRAELLSKRSPNSLQSQVSNCRALWMAVDRSSQPGTSSCLSVCLLLQREKVVSPQPASMTIYKSGSSHFEPLWFKNFSLFQLLPISNLGCFGSRIPTLPTLPQQLAASGRKTKLESKGCAGLKQQGQSSSI